eukprot:CAMPEP_0197856278 /NCGR_PEP_ID=MMETSP1438-20131217/28279_1 /TAXON_ID=1461541 /ORGANISM="Pterosperma sp., Strain CCMP1384" /LENGTH=272 /DNA_ID=CAMNT_0043471685 /DNA_START=99 /DNA_END=913 /DNA_ORIENTATION=+
MSSLSISFTAPRTAVHRSRCAEGHRLQPLAPNPLKINSGKATCRTTLSRKSAVKVTAESLPKENEGLVSTRRGTLGQLSLGMAAVMAGFTVDATLPLTLRNVAFAASSDPVFVAGATGLTGQLVVRELVKQGIPCIAGVRSVAKAEKLGLNVEGVEFRQFDVTDDPATTAKALEGVGSVICTIGFVPGNPLKFKQAAHAVDNVGTVNLVDAAVMAKVPKFVLMTSILTNGRAAGQEKSPGFMITNAFGGVLDEKLVAEKHLRASGLDYTIVR